MTVAPGHAEDAPTLASQPALGDQSLVAIEQVASLPVERQVAWLSRAAQSGELEKTGRRATDRTLSGARARHAVSLRGDGSTRYRECEFQAFSQQRVNGKWQTKPAHMLVRYRQEPRQVYVKWVADGRNAGQEMIYDEKKDPDQLYAHSGGILNFVSFRVPIDDARVKAQSNHTVRELDIDYFSDLFLAELKRYRAAGVEKPSKIEVLSDHGARHDGPPV